MGFRFRRSVKIAPGIRLNFGKKSTGISFGGKGGRISFNSKSGTRFSASIPGTGISYSSKIGGKRKKKNSCKTGKRSARKFRSSQNSAGSNSNSTNVGGILIAALFLISGISHLGESVAAGLLTAAIGMIILFLVFRKGTDNIEKTEQELQTSEESGEGVPSGPSPTDSFEAPEKAKLIKEDFAVVGASYYKENIMKLACANPDWKKHTKTLLSEGKSKVYRYNFVYKPVKLIPEPSNEHDANAVLVQIAGEKVGYVSREENIHVKDILENRSVKYISAFVGGGDYKLLFTDGSLEKQYDEISINIRIAYS